MSSYFDSVTRRAALDKAREGRGLFRAGQYQKQSPLVLKPSSWKVVFRALTKCEHKHNHWGGFLVRSEGRDILVNTGVGS